MTTTILYTAWLLALAVETTLKIDVGVIAAALAPTLAITVAALIARSDAKKSQEQGRQIHTLVNDQLTREKASRLALLKAQLLLLQRAAGNDLTEDDRVLIRMLEAQAEDLELEIEGRDAVAEELKQRGQE